MIERRWSHSPEEDGPSLVSPAGLDEVESALVHLAVGSRLDRLGAMVQEHLGAGGKRLRARLALAAAQALGLERDEAIPWAAACELLHNATLVHDDLQDGDDRRRGRPTLWAAHGAAQAINAGDLLLTLPYLAVRDLRCSDAVRWRLCEAIARRAEQTVRGQAMELDLLEQRKLGWHEWSVAARGKSGALLALPVEGAALLSGLDAANARRQAEPFATLGVLYQAMDDHTDLWGDKGRGSAGNDLREGKVSAPVVTHLALHPEDEDELVGALALPRDQTTDELVQRWIVRFGECGARASVEAFVQRSVRDLLEDPVLKAVPPLRQLAVEVLQRLGVTA
jgi:geranylgeranyl pyrophosphate synthase